MIKILVSFLIIFNVLNFHLNACSIDGSTGIAPENSLRIPVGLKSSSELKSEEQVDNILNSLSDHFSPLVRSYGARLDVYNDWYNDEVNAYASRPERNVYKINMQGGLARFPDMTEDAFIMVFCHELGHHIGAAPLKENHWASSEGQSDYWGAMKCFREYIQNISTPEMTKKIISKGLFLSKTLKRNCEAQYSDEDERNICIRTGLAGKKLAQVLNAMNGNSYKVDFDTPNLDITYASIDTHPEAQCRLDTYFQGALCNKPITHSTSNQSSLTGFCTQEMGYKIGYRPNCWYAPGPIRQDNPDEEDQTPPTEITFEEGLKLAEKFATQFYINSIEGNKNALLDSYAFPIQNYLGDFNVSKSTYIADIEKYYARWAKRKGELVNLEIDQTRSNINYYSVALSYRYYFTTKTGREVSGISTNFIKLKYLNNKFQISSIYEEVMRNEDSTTGDQNPPSTSSAFYNTKAILSMYFEEVLYGTNIPMLESFYQFPIANYFGDKNVSHETFLAQTANYYSKWKSRNAWITEISIDEKNSSNKKIIATLKYRYEFLSKQDKIFKGISKNTITLEWNGQLYVITSIDEKVNRDNF
jgi:hypothetical protein